jgi:MFS family permease
MTMFSVLKTREYRLLWIGQGISHLGDQFHLIALPWLVLSLTHDPLQLGIVLALAGVPRAALMLLGGAFADRHSPRTIMLVSDTLRFLLVGAMAAAVLTGSVRVWMVYVLAVGFGTVSGFFMPAAEAALPRLLETDQLEGGNALMMGASQLATFAGPAAAGTLIAVLGGSSSAGAAGLAGIGVALAVDAVSFAVSAGSLLLMRPLAALGGGAESHPFAAVIEGLRFSVANTGFRWMLGMIAFANLMIAGPLAVGIPVLAQTRFAEGAAAFGFIISAYGIGNLVGMVGAGSLPRASSRAFTLLVVGLFACFGAVIVSLGFVTSTWLAVAMMVVLGLGNGYIAVTAISTLQRMTPKAMIGLAPLSQAAAGAAIKLGPSVLFGFAGGGLLVLAAYAALRHREWGLDAMEAQSAAAVVEPA